MEQIDVQTKIKKLINEGLLELAPEFRVWAESHLIEPRQVQLIEKADSVETTTFWLVTDHTGNEDYSYRIVYDANRNQFGFEVTLEDDRELLIGIVGNFADTVNNI